MAWTPFAQAGMIGTDTAVALHSAQADRLAVAAYLARADVASQLQGLGIDAASAKDRVSAMSDEEVRTLAGRIDSLPAGGTTDGAAVLVVLVILVAIIYWQMKK